MGRRRAHRTPSASLLPDCVLSELAPTYSHSAGRSVMLRCRIRIAWSKRTRPWSTRQTTTPGGTLFRKSRARTSGVRLSADSKCGRSIWTNRLQEASSGFMTNRPFDRADDFGTTARTLKQYCGKTPRTWSEASSSGAYFEGELVGFMKWVCVGDIARMMQILSLNSHQEQRPMNALIAKVGRNMPLERNARSSVDGKFSYGNKVDDSMAEFKRRMGFKQLDYPRYFVTLNRRGSSLLRLGFHKGWIGVLPPSWIAAYRDRERAGSLAE